jgi:hypothetical protein
LNPKFSSHAFTNFQVGDTKILRKEHFLINVSQRFENKDNPSMDKLLETGRREIDVFTKLFPKLEVIWSPVSY